MEFLRIPLLHSTFGRLLLKIQSACWSQTQALIEKLGHALQSLIPDVEFIHYWTDSPLSQCRNKFMFKIVSCHEEYFNISASWNYMEAGHGKGLSDPIGGTAKRKADHAVKNDKAVIQDPHDF